MKPVLVPISRILLVPMVYFVISTLWVLVSDVFVWHYAEILPDGFAPYASMMKGVLFVVASSAVLMFIMHRLVAIQHRFNTKMRRIVRKLCQVSRESRHCFNELDAILNNSLVGVAFIDGSLVFRQVNRYFCNVMRTHEEHFVGIDISGTKEGNTLLYGIISGMIDDCKDLGRPVEREQEYVFPDGDKRWLQLSVSKVEPIHGMNGFVVVLRDITARKTNEERVAYLSYYDFLTGLPNRRLFYEKLNDACKKAKRYDTGFGVLYLDVNDFKSYNDTYGHDFGDAVLKAFARVLLSTLRESDVVARIGGDEFAVILGRIEKHSSLAKIATKLRGAIAEVMDVQGVPVTMSASIGYGLYPADGEEVDNLLGVADRHMYTQKKSSKSAAMVQ